MIALQFLGVLTVTDLALRRKLEGQICADVLRCHIASDARMRGASEQPARLSGQMASHHPASLSEEADVKRKAGVSGVGAGAGREGSGVGWRGTPSLHLRRLRPCSISRVCSRKCLSHVSHCARSFLLARRSTSPCLLY